MELIDIVPDCLYPRLVADRSHAIYAQDQGRHMMRPEQKAEERPLEIWMVEDIALQFVVERGEAMQLLREVDREGLAEWDNIALITRSFRNLRDIHGEDLKVQYLDSGVSRVVTTGQRHDASYLLLGNLWERVEEEFGANLYAAVPAPDMLLVAPESDRQAVLKLQRVIRNAWYELPASLLLSKAVYQRHEKVWEIIATAF